MTNADPDGGAYTSPPPISWPALWRGGLLALAIGFVLSTQLLFQFDLYQNWPVPDILLGWLDHLLDQLIVGGCVLAAIALALLVPTPTMAQKHALVLTAITLGALAGEALLILRLPLPPDISLGGVLFAKVARWVVVAGLAYAFFVFQRQAAQASTELHESELQRIQAEQQLAEARLQSLRAQIEPHFLFNTLATVQRLYRTEPDRGRKMLASFVTYLRTALPQMREEETTLRQEVDLARAYLDVLQVRMGDRLRVRFDIPSEIATLPFPPLALSTLTENAIKHGLTPLPGGGEIEITARVQNGQLKVGVADTGAGLRMSSGTGSGLANLRARLAALYGDTANLEFEANVPHGIRATIAVPVRSL
jgi:hypothetical protein